MSRNVSEHFVTRISKCSRKAFQDADLETPFQKAFQDADLEMLLDLLRAFRDADLEMLPKSISGKHLRRIS